MSGVGLAASLQAKEFPERLLLHICLLPSSIALSLLAVSAARNVAPRNSDGGSSDPYCVVYYGEKKEKTKPVLKTLNPIWNESFVFVVDARVQSLKLEIYDVGTLRDEGEAVIDLRQVLVAHRAVTNWKGSGHKKPVTGDVQVALCASSIAELFRKDPARVTPEELISDLKTLEYRFVGTGFDTHLVSARLRLGKSSFTYPGRVAISQHIPHVLAAEYMPIGADKDRKCVTVMMWIYALNLPTEVTTLFRCCQEGSYAVNVSSKLLAWTNGGSTSSLGVLPSGRWVHLSITFSNGSIRTLIDGSLANPVVGASCPDPLNVLRAALTLGGAPQVNEPSGHAIWGFADGISIVLGDLTPEEIKNSLDSHAPVDVVSNIMSGGTPQDFPILRAVPTVSTRFVSYLAQLCNHSNDQVKSEAKALAQQIGVRITTLLNTPACAPRFLYSRTVIPYKEASGVMAMAVSANLTFVASSRGTLSVYDDHGTQVLTKQRHDARIHGMLVVAETLWTSGEDNKIVVSRASTPFADICTMVLHTAMIRALTLVTYNGEARVWSGDVAGNVHIWDPFGLDWEQIGSKAANVPSMPLPVSPKELEGLACMCQVKDSVWLGTRKAILIFDLKTQSVTRTVSMAYAPNKLCYVPGSVVWCASAAPEIQILDDVGEKVNQIKGHTSKILSLYHWASKNLVLSGGFDTTIFAWNCGDFSCATDLKGRHKDGIRAMISPDNANTLWTGSDDKDAGVQVYTVVEQGLELASFVGPLLPYVLILSRECGVELLERFCAMCREWDLNTDVCRSSLAMIAPAFQGSVKGGSAYDRWSACYLALLTKIPANYTGSFYPTVLKDICSVAATSESNEMRGLAISAMGALGKNKGNREQILNELSPKGNAQREALSMLGLVPDIVSKNALWELVRDRLDAMIAIPSTLWKDVGLLKTNSKLADVCFYPGGLTPVHAHKVIVAARCKALGLMITAECVNLPPGSVVDIRLPNVTPRVFRCINSFIYGATAPHLPSDLEGMLAVLQQAQEWNLEDLSSYCISRIRQAKKTPKETVQLILLTREMPNNPQTKMLADAGLAELMGTNYLAVQNVDLKPLGQEYLATLFKRLRRKEIPELANYEPPNMSLKLARDFDNLGLEHSDFKIRMGESDFIPSYKCLLYARSQYFAQLFEPAQSPSELTVNVSPEVMRVVHSFLLSDTPNMGPLNGDLNKVYELIAALDVFQPNNENCLVVALDHLRELRGEAVIPKPQAPKPGKTNFKPPDCKNHHPCNWATGSQYNCDRCGARSLPGTARWQCRPCDYDFCTSCVPAAGVFNKPAAAAAPRASNSESESSSGDDL